MEQRYYSNRKELLSKRIDDNQRVFGNIFFTVINGNTKSFIINPLTDDDGFIIDQTNDDDNCDDGEYSARQMMTHVTMQCLLVRELLGLLIARDVKEWSHI